MRVTFLTPVAVNKCVPTVCAIVAVRVFAAPVISACLSYKVMAPPAACHICRAPPIVTVCWKLRALIVTAKVGSQRTAPFAKLSTPETPIGKRKPDTDKPKSPKPGAPA